MKIGGMRQHRRREEFTNDLRDFILESLLELGIEEGAAAEHAEKITLSVHERWRGLSIVFPMWPEIVQQRIKAIFFREYDGTNMDELVRKLNISENTLYKWVEQRYKELYDKNQCNLDF